MKIYKEKGLGEILLNAVGSAIILIIVFHLLTSKPTNKFLDKKAFDLYIEYSTEIDSIEMDVIIEGEGEIQIYNSILTIHEYYCTDIRSIRLTE